MNAKIEESRAKLVEAEAEVPKAMAEAFATQKLTIMDYYRLKNVEADTHMRRSIADAGIPPPKPSRKYSKSNLTKIEGHEVFCPFVFVRLFSRALSCTRGSFSVSLHWQLSLN